MVRFTLLEVNLDGPEFNASAPFSDTDPGAAKERVEAGLRERLERDADSGDSVTSGGNASPASVLFGLVAVVVTVVVGRKLRSRARSEQSETSREAPIVAD